MYSRRPCPRHHDQHTPSGEPRGSGLPFGHRASGKQVRLHHLEHTHVLRYTPTASESGAYKRTGARGGNSPNRRTPLDARVGNITGRAFRCAASASRSPGSATVDEIRKGAGRTASSWSASWCSRSATSASMRASTSTPSLSCSALIMKAAMKRAPQLGNSKPAACII